VLAVNTMSFSTPSTSSGFGTALAIARSSAAASGKLAAKISEDARLIDGAPSDVSKQHVSTLPR
jgi:hypothetical protein